MPHCSGHEHYIIITLNISQPQHFKRRKVLLLNFRGLSTNQYPWSFINVLGVLAFWNDKRKIEKIEKNEICNRNVDLPC